MRCTKYNFSCAEVYVDMRFLGYPLFNINPKRVNLITFNK